MKKYRRVTYEDRIKIQSLLSVGLTHQEIADKLKFHKSTICREIQRNKGKRGYRRRQAQMKAERRQVYKKRPRKMDSSLIFLIEKLLEKKWSPEQISNRLKKERKSSISAETIYTHILADRKSGGYLYKNLRRNGKLRKKRFPSADRRGQINDARSIEERGKNAQKRRGFGNWERDLMVGRNHKGALIVCVDRKSRYMKIAHLANKNAHLVTAETIKILKNLPCKSITNDRGLEFADHLMLERKMKLKVFFCHPYSPHERGSNENKIGILRQYFPKRTHLKKISAQTIAKVEFEINNRPMKCLDWLTPYEVLLGKKVALTT